MMEQFFIDPEEVSLPQEDRLPPQDVRIREFRLEPWSEGRRVRVLVEVDPFQRRPSLEVVVRNEAGEIVAEVMVIESITRKIEFNAHLRQPEPAGFYHAQVSLFYQELPDPKEGEPVPVELPRRMQVDFRERSFEITS